MEMTQTRVDVERIKQAAEWELRLRESQLSDEEMTSWLAWCEADQDNLAAFEEAQSLWRRIPPEFGAHYKTQKAAAGWKRMALAASILVAAAGTALYWRESLIPSERIEAPLGVNRDSILPDGTNMALGAGSAVAVDFTPKQRHLKMTTGTAFFDVKADRSRPFVVSAGVVDITAVGTAFNVRRNEQRVVVTVTEGVVRIVGRNQKAAQVNAGEQLTYETASQAVRIRTVADIGEMAWRQGQLIYNGEPLDVVIENVNRYSARRIELRDSSLARLRFTGTIFTDSVDSWLNALEGAFDVTVERDEDRDVITKRGHALRSAPTSPSPL